MSLPGDIRQDDDEGDKVEDEANVGEGTDHKVVVDQKTQVTAEVEVNAAN